MIVSSFHALVGRHRQMEMGFLLGSWFDGLTTSGRDTVRPEALEGRTGYLRSSEGKRFEPPEIASSLTLLTITSHTPSN